VHQTVPALRLSGGAAGMQAAVLDGIGAKDIDGDFSLCLRARLRLCVVLKILDSARGVEGNWRGRRRNLNAEAVRCLAMLTLLGAGKEVDLGKYSSIPAVLVVNLASA